jgi:hypothetical protein
LRSGQIWRQSLKELRLNRGRAAHYRLGIGPGDIEDDLGGTVRKDIFRERELVHPLGSKDEGNAVYSAFGQKGSEDSRGLVTPRRPSYGLQV